MVLREVRVSVEDDGEAEVRRVCAELRPQLVGALTLHTGERAVAEELAQEALVRLWQRWPRVRELDAPQAWAHRVAANLATSWWRRRTAERRAHRRMGAERGEEPSTGAAEVLALRQAVAGLPRRQREALVLRHYLQLPAEEAAQAMGCAAGTVRALCRQGLDRLRQQGVIAETEPQEATDG